MAIQKQIEMQCEGRGIYDLTSRVAQWVQSEAAQRGLCNIFVHHTSASLILCENADPDVRSDLEAFFSRLVPDGDSLYRHVDEGPDDMPAHVRSVLTTNSLSVPVAGGRLLLGTWQGIYIWEHRHAPHCRRITLTLLG